MESAATRNRKQQKEKITCSRQFTSEEKIELHSFLFSFIFHTIFLLTLALLYSAPEISKPIVLKISFGSDTEDFVDTGVVIENIESMIPEQSENNDHLVMSALPTINSMDNNSEIEIEPINIDHNNKTQSLLESVPIESLTQEIAENKTQQKESFTVSKNEPKDSANVLGELVKTTAAGLLSQNTNSGSIGGYGSTGRYSGNGMNIGNTTHGEDTGIKERLSVAGAKTGDVQISIAWDTIDDIDVHVMLKSGNIIDGINWTRRIGRSRGVLDVDMNASPPYLHRQPVENIFWPFGSSPNGMFIVYIHFYRSWTGKTQVPVLVRIKSGDNIETFNAVAILGKNPEEITRFNR